MRPKVITPAAGGDGAGGLWAYNADTHLTDWLEAMGHRFDVLTDEDLERDGVSALRDYNVVISGTHPEYYSPSMWDAVKSYTEDGGRLMYMGGNGFYWRIDFHPDLPGVIEVRRGGESTRAWRAEPGEEHHSFSGELGGTWRRLGRPPQALAASGFVAQGFDFCTHFLRTPESKNPRAAWMFSDIGERERLATLGSAAVARRGSKSMLRTALSARRRMHWSSPPPTSYQTPISSLPRNCWSACPIHRAPPTRASVRKSFSARCRMMARSGRRVQSPGAVRYRTMATTTTSPGSPIMCFTGSRETRRLTLTRQVRLREAEPFPVSTNDKSLSIFC